MNTPYAFARPTSELPEVSFEPFITAGEVALMLHAHPVTILRWAREGLIPCHRIGRKVLFRASTLNAGLANTYTGIAVRAA